MTANQQAMTAQHQTQLTMNGQIASIKKAMDSKGAEIRALIGDDEKAQRLMMGAMMIATDNEKVRECSPMSIVKATLQAAMVGADVAAGVGEGYFIPRAKQCTFMPGYRLGQRVTQQETGYRIIADTVYTGDAWECSNIPVILRHAPGFPERGEFVLAYAAAIDKSGNVVMFQLASNEDIQNALEAGGNGTKGSPAWRTWFDRQARKVPIMRLAKEMRGLKIKGDAARIDRVLEADALFFKDTPEKEAGMLTEGKQRFGFATAEAGRAAVEPEVVEAAKPKTEKKAKAKAKVEPKPDKEAPPQGDGQWDNVGPPPVGEAQDADFDPVTGEVDTEF